MIDSHIHLDNEAYLDDWQEVLERAQEEGVVGALIPALHLDSARRSLAMAQTETRLAVAVGIHPHQAALYDPSTFEDEVRELSGQAVALGETGLECHYDFCPLEQQLTSLRAHLDLARELGMPVILHCREAEQLLWDELKSRPGLEGVVHCFTGGWEWAQKFLDQGFHLGVTGMVTFPKATAVHEVAKHCPAERLLVETDGPYLAPKPHRGRRNSPAYIPLVVTEIARLRDSSPEEVGQASAQATRELFKISIF